MGGNLGLPRYKQLNFLSSFDVLLIGKNFGT